jgi:hypothetical protein
MRQVLPFVLIAAAVTWIISEAMELAAGGRTTSTLYLTAVFHLLMGIGIWGAYMAQAVPRHRASLVGAAMTSLGYLVLVYPPLAISTSPLMTISEFMATNAPFRIAGFLAVSGTVILGVAFLRAREYPVWTGIALVLCPIAFAGVISRGGPDVVVIAANIIQGLALAAIGLRAQRLQLVPA